jgi:hypothetical protein
MPTYFVVLILLANPTPDALEAAVSAHQREYRGLRFEYIAELKLGADGEFETVGGKIKIKKEPTAKVVKVVQSLEEFQVFDAELTLESVETRPQRVWVQWSDSANEKGRTLSYFLDSDGTNTRRFRLSNLETGKWSDAHIVPWQDWASFEENVFDRFLHLNASGLPQVMPGVPPPNPYRYELVGASEVLGELVYEMTGSFDRSPYIIEVKVGAPSNSIVVSSVTKEIATGKVIEEYLVEEIGEFEGVKFPSKGKYVRQPSGIAGYRHYEFSVTGVTRLSIEQTRSGELFRNFPPGTTVQDQISGKNYDIPFDEADALEKAQFQKRTASGSRGGRELLLVLNLCLLTAIVYVVYRWRRIK